MSLSSLPLDKLISLFKGSILWGLRASPPCRLPTPLSHSRGGALTTAGTSLGPVPLKGLLCQWTYFATLGPELWSIFGHPHTPPAVFFGIISSVGRSRSSPCQHLLNVVQASLLLPFWIGIISAPSAVADPRPAITSASMLFKKSQGGGVGNFSPRRFGD